MNNMTPDEILVEIDKIRTKNKWMKDEKSKPLNDNEISSLPLIPNGWKWVSIHELSKFITNGVHTPTSFVDTNGYGLHCLRITDIQNNDEIDYDKLPFCLRIVNGDYEKKLRKGDIYFSFTGNNLGKRYIVKEDREDTVFAHYFVRWHPILVNPYYIYYVTYSTIYDYFINGHKLGSSQPNLKVTDLKRFPIPLCDLLTQNKIANVLKTIDDKIELNNKINNNLHEVAEILFKCVYEKGKKCKLEELISNVSTGSRPKGGAEISGIPSVGAEKIEKFGIYNYSSEKYISEEYFNKLKNGIIKSGDVLLYKDGAYTGKVSMALNGFPHDKCAVNEHVFIISTKDNWAKYYLYFTLYNQENRNKIFTMASSKAAQPGLNQSELKALDIKLADKEEIIKFEKKVESIMFEISHNTLQNKMLKQLRDTILPKLMNGEIKLDNIEI